MDNQTPPPVTVNLKVTNKNTFDIEDRFDGVPYVFPAKKSLTIPAEAALHMLGWQPGIDLKAVEKHVQRRWGWNTPELVKSGDSAKYFKNLELKPVTYRMVEVIEEGEAAAA